MPWLFQLQPKARPGLLTPLDDSGPTYADLDAQTISKLFPPAAMGAMAQANKLLELCALSLKPDFDSIQVSYRGGEAVEKNLPVWTLQFAQVDIEIAGASIRNTGSIRCTQKVDTDGTLTLTLDLDVGPAKGKPFGSEISQARFTITKSPDGPVHIVGSYKNSDEESQALDYTFQMRPRDGKFFVSGPHPDFANERIDHYFTPSN